MSGLKELRELFSKILGQDQENSDDIKSFLREMAEKLPDGLRLTREEKEALKNGECTLARARGHEQIITEAEPAGCKKGNEVEVERPRGALSHFNREIILKLEEVEDLRRELASEKEKCEAVKADVLKLMRLAVSLCSAINNLNPSQSRIALKSEIESLKKKAQEVWE